MLYLFLNSWQLLLQQRWFVFKVFNMQPICSSACVSSKDLWHRANRYPTEEWSLSLSVTFWMSADFVLMTRGELNELNSRHYKHCFCHSNWSYCKRIVMIQQWFWYFSSLNKAVVLVLEFHHIHWNEMAARHRGADLRKKLYGLFSRAVHYFYSISTSTVLLVHSISSASPILVTNIGF